jgi:hypothetical protein
VADDGQFWEQTAQATVAADGTATVYLIPNAAGRYLVQMICVSVSVASSPSSVAKIYRDQPAAQRFIEGTSSGDGDADTTVGLRLTTGQQLVAAWTGAAPAAIATLRVEGQFGREGG